MLDLAGQRTLTWIKARASAGVAMCVEVAALPEGIAVRHSLTPEDGVLIYTRAEFAAFLDGAKRGEFDHLVERTGEDEVLGVVGRALQRVDGLRRAVVTMRA